MHIRLHDDVTNRLRDTAVRYGLTMSLVVNKAVNAFAKNGRVVDLPKKRSTTRKNSMPMRLGNLPGVVDAKQVPQVIEWYLDRYDKGGSRPVADMRDNGDGTVSCDAPADCMKGLPAAKRAIRKKTLAVRA